MDPSCDNQAVIFWDGDENPTRLIENILPILLKFSNVPVEKLQEMVSTTVLTTITGKYENFEFTTEFDEKGMFHLKHENFEFLPALSTGDKVVIWISLLAVIYEAATNDLLFILYRPFYRIDAMKRVQLVASLKGRDLSPKLIFY